MWKFIKSSSDKTNWYLHNQKEICFIGRSNVGKSSLINALSGNKKLAKTSKTPGRTQLINYFETPDKKVIVDLPGYGFANISISIQKKMFEMIDEYFNKANPTTVFVLIDSRRGITEKDEEIINYLLDLNHNVLLILTKVDKANQSEIHKAMSHPFFKKLNYFKSSINNEKLISLINDYIKSI